MDGTAAALSHPTMSVEDAAKLLGVSRAHGYQLAKAGEFPAKVIRVGRSYRVVTSSMNELLSPAAA